MNIVLRPACFLFFDSQGPFLGSTPMSYDTSYVLFLAIDCLIPQWPLFVPLSFVILFCFVPYSSQDVGFVNLIYVQYCDNTAAGLDMKI